MNPTPLVSTIIPTYNRADLVSEAIDSVLRQSYPNVEVIVVDDGSTDDTCDRLKRYGTRVRLISQSNAGPSAARNRGIAAARGELIAFLDSDDLWLPEKLERQVRLLQAAGDAVPCCLSNIMMEWRDRAISSFEISGLKSAVPEGIWLNPPEILATRFVLFNQGVVIRREVLAKVGGFDARLRLLEDYELSLRLALHLPWAFIQEPLVIWRESASSCYQDSRRDDAHVQLLLGQILERSLGLWKQHDETGKTQQLLVRELTRTRRQLKWSELRRSRSATNRTIGPLLQVSERYLRSAYRHSPWFPRMKSAPVDVPQSLLATVIDESISQTAMVRD